jgi:Tol biopolymer transport system component
VLPTGGRPRAVLNRAFLRRVRPAIGSATWSPDGKRIAFLAIAYGLSREAIFVIGADGRNIQRVWSMRLRSSDLPQANSLAWSPDGRRLAFSIGTGRPALHVFTLRTRRLQRLHTLEGTSDGLMPGLDWSPDSRSIVFTGVVPVARPRGDPVPMPAVMVLSLSGGQPQTVVVPTWDPGVGGLSAVLEPMT